MKFTDNGLKSRFLSACEGVTSGIVVIKTPEGETHRFGSSGEEAVLEIHDWAVVSAMSARGQIGLGETYVHGLWLDCTCEYFGRTTACGINCKYLLHFVLQ